MVTVIIALIPALIYKAERQLRSASLDVNFGVDESFSYSEILEDTENTLMDETEFDMLLSSAKLDEIEQDFLRLRIEGMTMEEITQDLGDSAYKIRHNLQEKVKYLLFGEDSKIYKVSSVLARYLAKETPVLPSPMIRGILFNFENLP